jgi:hypothetical protein
MEIREDESCNGWKRHRNVVITDAANMSKMKVMMVRVRV